MPAQYDTDYKSVRIPIVVHKCDTFTCRLKGLMFRKQPLEQEGLWLIPCNAIHMFFMSFPIDVLFLDKKQKIVKTVSRIKPWKTQGKVKEAHSALELPEGTIEAYDIQEGDYILVDDEHEILLKRGRTMTVEDIENMSRDEERQQELSEAQKTS
ncbi:DUF192 domain-containing protein [Caldalkalibacillus salinus]|uniref:DUF192 domain-containing protein n=1 Tax=Caldalkalibacillus salinus TaxID=2803787 RepID=UPI0019206800|nr:DUF192 domain-containing protein [Caldalkalibacillus salinus]